ncbi:4Fe-4S binding protein [Clostridium sp. SHJSY1]|uniref:4Fe-4S binding protein n=1 Tax=Clostridium sp. SHJSY1 TaxID=2942483 RepID=UPI002875104F|nr:4Fe-4S binding protein [Clostridium sp. SHJSY1]MDS0524612.1 4Fe-4S binding protein [Clostridium sp. SHJSY1]
MNLNTKISGIYLENPLMPASGPLVGDNKKMKIISEFGVGGMVTKTISSKAAEVVKPCIYGGQDFVMNAELWSEFGPEMWIDNFLPKIKKDINTPLIVSVGYSKEDMDYLIPKLDKYADAFEISTHYVGKDLDVIKENLKTIRKHTKKPIFMKISPHIPDLIGFAKMVMENGGNGVVAINSLGPTMKIDITSRKVLLGNKEGEAWTSGPRVKPMALAIIHKIKKAIPSCEIIGVGGISTADDVIEFLLAGASAVQMLSAAMLKGKDLYKKIIDDLPEALEKYGFNSIKEVINTELQTGDVKYDPIYPLINYDKCVNCKLCEKICPYFAISSEDGKVAVKESECFGCGLCQSRCPKKAIENIF